MTRPASEDSKSARLSRRADTTTVELQSRKAEIGLSPTRSVRPSVPRRHGPSTKDRPQTAAIIEGPIVRPVAKDGRLGAGCPDQQIGLLGLIGTTLFMRSRDAKNYFAVD